MTKLKQDYTSAIEAIIKYQISLLGAQIVLNQVSKIPGLKIENTGNVIYIDSNPQKILQSLVNVFFNLSGLVFKAKIEPILNKYPDLPVYVSS